MLCNLLPLGRSVAAVGKRETVKPGSPASFAAPSTPDHATTARLSVAQSKLPIMFEANLGQTDPQVKFLSRGAGYTIFLTPAEAVILLSKGQLSEGRARSRTQAVLRMKLAGAAGEPQVVGLEELRGKSNYFIGSDPEKWRTDVPLYARVQYKAIYPGIDLVYYGNQGELEYDFVVGAGADPAQIRLSFDGAQKIRTDANGDLVLKTPGGEVRQRKPHVYQEVEGVKKEIKGRYVLKGRHEVGFALAGYDRDKPLIIDPVLSYATYLGGNVEDEARAIAVDSDGYAYVTGYTYSTNFYSKNAFQPDLTRYSPPVSETEPWKGQDAFITKFDPSITEGDSVVYSTFLGGTSEERGCGIAVDSNGNAYITGTTKSFDNPLTPEHELEFPVVNAFQAHLNSGGREGTIAAYWEDAFVAKVSAGGNGLLYSTYFGGSGADEVSAIAVDSFGNAYIIGTKGEERANRLPGYDFPVRHAFQATSDSQDAFVAKFDTSSSGDASLIFSTFLGGAAPYGDKGHGIAVTPSGGNIYVTGSTSAPNFPTKNAYQPEKGYNSNVFVTVFNDTRPLSLLYSTFLGTF
ncbi:MAG: SBBP repeat-containing protein, partial [Chloroflexia bacterium]